MGFGKGRCIFLFNKSNKICWYILVFVLLLLNAPVFAQLSPGDLTNAHSKLEGISNCTSCHELGEKITNDKCLDCHKEIKNLIEKNAGYHSSIDVKNKFCSKCHSEHHGRNFQIIHFDENKFNHASTGFTLTGKHLQTDCKKCHQTKFITYIDLKKRKNTFLGLQTSCANCHDDVHQKTLGDNCDDCHNTEAFKPAPLFNHNKTKFRLTGRHVKVDCIKCHIKETREGKEFQKFTGLRFNNCSSCHSDVHKGKFGENCESCHSTSGFKNINTVSFDHSKTNFALLGKHRRVKCADCHGVNLASKPKYKLCTDCHKDYHKGQFVTKENSIRDCKDCHNVLGFSPSLFTIDLHKELKFKLTGSHLAVSCKNCHWEKDKWAFKGLGIKCIDCHKNVHGNEIAEKFLGKNDCENCHSTNSWEQIKFDHKRTTFVLLGKHAETDCRKCHTTKDITDKIEYKFRSVKPQCETCHRDIHFGQFKVDQKTDCTRCHDFSNWKPVKFDHEKSKFSLKGAHSKLSCDKCHKEVVVNTNKFIKYKLEDFKCATCHSY